MKNYVVRFLKDKSGATAIEYGLIAALIAVGIIAAARSLGSQVGDDLQHGRRRDEEDLSRSVPTRAFGLRLRGRSPSRRATHAVFDLSGSARSRARSRSPHDPARRRRLCRGDGPPHHEDPQSHLRAHGAGVLSSGAAGGLGAWDILYHVAAGLAVLAFGVLLFIPGWFGGGDAKLMAAIALWIGPRQPIPLYLLCGHGRRHDRHRLSPRRVRCRCRACFSARPGRCGCTGAMPAFPTALRWPPARCSSIRTPIWFASLVR